MYLLAGGRGAVPGECAEYAGGEADGPAGAAAGWGSAAPAALPPSGGSQAGTLVSTQDFFLQKTKIIVPLYWNIDYCY